MSTDRPEELKKTREKLTLNLKPKRHRCEWCDFISIIKDQRKSEAQHPRTLFHTTKLFDEEPLAKKTRQIANNDIRIEDNSCTKFNSNLVRPNASTDA